MTDLYLKAMMEGAAQSKKDKFEEAIEKDLQAYVDSLALEDESDGSQLITVKIKRVKLFEELKEDIKMPELGQFLDNACAFIKTEGLRYLDRPKYDALIAVFDSAAKFLERFDPFQEIPVKLRDLLKISDESIDTLYEIAKEAFKEERYQDSLSVLVLLTILDQTNADFWFRMGIAAQKSENIELALRAYAICLESDPDQIGARLFLAECQLIQGNKDATFAIAEAKKIIERSELDPVWLDLLASLEKRSIEGV